MYDHQISIHPFLPVVGVVSSLITFGFCIALVLYPLSMHYDGTLHFISDGMNAYAGWSGAVLGSTGMFIGLCEMVAALHTNNLSLLTAVFVQAPSWCILIGVSGTGWPIHYISLVIFLSSTHYFHYQFAASHPMASSLYHRLNLFTLMNLLLLLISFTITHCLPSTGSAERIWLDITVSFELTLMGCVTAQNLCVAWVLNQYKDIHILFEHYNDDVF